MVNNKILTPEFFNRNSFTVAKELLGKFLVRQIDDTQLSLMVNEVEVYDGFEDLASHGRFGETERTKVMYGAAGHIYIYLIYGMHFMLNISMGKTGYPAALLIRGAGEISGPGRLTKYLQITKALNAKPATPKSGLWFEDRGLTVNQNQIQATPRIGIDYAGEWAQKPHRFILPSPSI